MKPSWIFVLITVGVIGWGVYHAVGAYLYNHHPGRAVVVLACVAAYLGFWWLMMASRKRRLAREADAEPRD